MKSLLLWTIGAQCCRGPSKRPAGVVSDLLHLKGQEAEIFFLLLLLKSTAVVGGLLSNNSILTHV